MRSLGWADYLKIEMTNNRKTLTASYWMSVFLCGVLFPAVQLTAHDYSRQTPPVIPGRPPPPPHRSKLPALGGTLTISIVTAHAPPRAGGGPARSPKARVLVELQQRSKIGGAKPSDEVEGLKFQVKWEPAKRALGTIIPQEESTVASAELFVVGLHCYLFCARK
jgi:mediator of RNA polymerase II transcription subunit 14